MNHFINTAATDIARARTVGLNQLTPEPFPVIMLGSAQLYQFFFGNRGLSESFSGADTYTLRVTVGNAFAGPTDGTWTIQVASNTAVTLRSDINAAGLSKVLNDDSTIAAFGGVLVTQTGDFQFLISFLAVGTPPALTIDGRFLVPDSAAQMSVITTGAAGVRQMVSITLRRTVPAQVSSWNAIYSPAPGWSGILPITTSAAIELLRINGVVRGDFIECTTLLTAEVLDSDGNSSTYCQAPVTLRAPSYAVAVGTNINPQMQNFFAKPLIVGLASNASNSTLLGGLITATSTYPLGSTVQCLFANDVVAHFVLKASTANQSVPFVVRPYDYNSFSNPNQWVLDRVTKQAQICSWDADTAAWHYQTAEGNANAVGLAVDQTGFSLPA